MRKLTIAATFGVALSPGRAFAHAGHEEASSLAAGLLHPVTGLDHLLAMVAVGLIAALSGGRMLWALPLAFVGAMLAGAGAGLMGWTLPGVEPMIAASVVVLGGAAALSAASAGPLLLAGAASFGFLHGFAHGLEAPHGGSVFGYLLGFTLATAALHGLGVLIGRQAPALAARAAGGAIALAGIGLTALTF